MSSVYNTGNPSFKRAYFLMETLRVPSSLIQHGWTWRCWGCESRAAPTQEHRQEGSSSRDVLLKNMKMEQPQPDKSHPSLNRSNRCSVQLLWLKYASFLFGHRHYSSSCFLHLLLSFSLSFICSSLGRWSKPANKNHTSPHLRRPPHTQGSSHFCLWIEFKQNVKFSFKSRCL